jgi:hypothetical protein
MFMMTVICGAGPPRSKAARELQFSPQKRKRTHELKTAAPKDAPPPSSGPMGADRIGVREIPDTK